MSNLYNHMFPSNKYLNLLKGNQKLASYLPPPIIKLATKALPYLVMIVLISFAHIYIFLKTRLYHEIHGNIFGWLKNDTDKSAASLVDYFL